MMPKVGALSPDVDVEFDRLALELPYGDDIAQTTRAVALIFHDEILYLPWRDRHAVHAKLSLPNATRNLIALVLREMQRHARVILLEQGCEIFAKSKTQPVSLLPEEREIVQRVWDGLGQAPAWTAFESQIDQLASRYKEED
jgi:hypothetical protein